ncbi:MAG: hypothetical protein ACOYT4_02965 [Nanoarchaeota archaeon]
MTLRLNSIAKNSNILNNNSRNFLYNLSLEEEYGKQLLSSLRQARAQNDLINSKGLEMTIQGSNEKEGYKLNIELRSNKSIKPIPILNIIINSTTNIMRIYYGIMTISNNVQLSSFKLELYNLCNYIRNYDPGKIELKI